MDELNILSIIYNAITLPIFAYKQIGQTYTRVRSAKESLDAIASGENPSGYREAIKLARRNCLVNYLIGGRTAIMDAYRCGRITRRIRNN